MTSEEKMTSEDRGVAVAPAPAKVAKRKLRQTHIARIARQIAAVDFGAGALAELRRRDAGAVSTTSAFHRLTAPMNEETWGGDKARRWATVIQAMAIGTKPGEAGANASAGAALAEAGFAESRFARLLAARGDTFRDQIILLARYMNSRQSRFDWADLGELVLVEGLKEQRAEKLRFRIARDYYRAIESRRGDER